MALEGPLKELHIQDVFQLLDLGRKTGILRVTSELRHTSGTVCFERGGVVAATLGADHSAAPLGTVLLRAGRIQESDLDRARVLQGEGDHRRLGDVLIAIGAISRRELERQLKAQIEEAIFDLLTWTEGYFRFDEGGTCQSAVEAPVRIATETLLMEAARRIDEWSRIEARVPHLRIVPRLQPSEGAERGRLDLVPFEWEVLAAIDGSRDLRAIAEVLGRTEFEVARTGYALATAGVVTLDDPTRSSAARAETADSAASDAALEPAREALGGRHYAAAVDALIDVLRADPLLPEARRLLGLALAGMGRFRQAEEAWDGWTRLGTRTPAEEAAAPVVQRLREAAATLAQELEGFGD